MSNLIASDRSNIHITDVVDIDELQQLFEMYSNTTGMATALLDLEGTVLIATNWQDSCTQFHRQNEITKQRCLESDTALACSLDEGAQYTSYECKNGLVDVATPVIINGEHLANFFTGQFFYQTPDLERFSAQADATGMDKPAYLEAIKNVPVYDRETIEGHMRFLVRMAEIIARLGASNLNARQSKLELETQKQALECKVQERTQELTYALRQQELMANGSKDGFWHWQDPVKDTVVWSDNLFTLLGYSPQEFSPSFELFQSMLHPDDVENTVQAVNAAIEHEDTFETQYRIRNKNGEYIWFRGRGTPYYNREGEFIEMAGSISDITQAKDLEESLIKTNQQLTDARNDALKNANIKSQFLANMSHEIRTPMNGIVGLTNLLLGTELNEEQRAWAKSLKASSDALITIISDILDISKIESGKLNIESTAFDITQLLDEIEGPLRASSISKSIDLSIDCDPMDHSCFIGDPTRIKQVLTNLANNAIKFTDGGGSVKIAVKQTETDTPDKTLLRFEVSDSGIGIPDENQEMLFDRFTQADSSTTRRYGGTGLGLHICKQLVDLMGGSIGCESKLGQGSRFWFTLPLLSTEMLSHARTTTDKANLNGLTALVVEDVEINQVVAVSLLESMGVITDLAGNGSEALEKLKSKSYDIVFMDCHMPVMDGFEATRQIRQMPQHQSLPIVAITAGVMKDEQAKCLDSGMNLVISKPFEPDDICLAVTKLHLR